MANREQRNNREKKKPKADKSKKKGAPPAMASPAPGMMAKINPAPKK